MGPDSDSASSESYRIDTESESAFPVVKSSLPSKECQNQPTKTEKPNKKYKCPEVGCNSVFVRPSKLARHVRQHTKERPYKCDHTGCTKAYTNSSHLKRHYETHNSVKQTYKCTKCSLSISNQHNLKRHYERVHVKRSRFSCDTCGLTFVKERRLTEHKATHDGNPLYTCDICNKKFLTLRMFGKHQESHKSKREYPCTSPDCMEIFSKWSHLCNHMKNKHVSESKCKVCDKVFLSKAHLKQHSVVHSESRSIIPCPYEKCPRFYFFKRNLDHHMRTSHLGKKFECDICKISLSTKQKLIEHMTKIHQSKRKRIVVKRLKRNTRKDAGQATKSMLSKLVGLDLSPQIEKTILKRKSRVKLSAEVVESSESEADRERVIKELEEDLRKVIHKVPQNDDVNLSDLESSRNSKETDVGIDKEQLKISENIDSSKIV